ncbi:regulator of chromosome condensation 1/beta-lactamase-inhibitor protein II [Multifurca ochricompacta]|uniref:Regulator of chromosome condensation 1/beta-lactamase-inhibitor protein II n=1 Tax=Multifurca ochricompacta TaxID=376703 RepID=A0AAD4M477_9AGAM|nr:regulator of chromosome condensation 1/beta-lactamase-inhibitor protein II [Multifurca ochricompacta]
MPQTESTFSHLLSHSFGPKVHSSKIVKTSTSRKRTQPQPSTSDTSQSPPPSLKRSRSTATLKEVNGIANPIKKTRTDETTPELVPQPKRTRKAASETGPPINIIPTFPTKMDPPAQIFVWGTGNFGQFGMGPSYLDELSKPTRNTWVEEKIAHGVFGTGPGSGIVRVWSCGVNDDAALGRITKDVPDPNNPGQFLNVDILTTIPHPLQTLVDDGFRALKIAAGDSISAAISTEGQLRVWGSFRANEGALGFSTGLTHQFIPKAALPKTMRRCRHWNNHLLVLTTSGSIYSWGAGEQGQLGRKILERRKIHGTNPERVVLGTRGRRAVVVGAGSFHSFAVDEEGAVWGWGLNSAGQTGTGINPADSDSIVQTPRRVFGLDGIRVVEITGGDLHTLFLAADGRVFACGRSDSAQLGLPLDHPAMTNADHVVEPVHVPFPDSHEDDPVVHIAAGTRFNAAVTRDGAMYTWGEGAQGEVGIAGEERVQLPPLSCGGQAGPGPPWVYLAVVNIRLACLENESHKSRAHSAAALPAPTSPGYGYGYGYATSLTAAAVQSEPAGSPEGRV